MKSKKLVLMMLGLFIMVAQTMATDKAEPFTFYVYDDLSAQNVEIIESHYLGTAITPKWNIFLKNYTHRYDVSVGLSDNGFEIRKPAVYHAVMRANKYVRKMLRKGELSHGDAVREMTHVLDCANTVIFESDTKDFEQAAEDAASGEEALQFFDSVVLIKQ